MTVESRRSPDGLPSCAILVDGREAAIAIYQSGTINVFELRTRVATTEYGVRVGDAFADLVATERSVANERRDRSPMPLRCKRDKTRVTCQLGTSNLDYEFFDVPGTARSGKRLHTELAGRPIDRIAMMTWRMTQEEEDFADTNGSRTSARAPRRPSVSCADCTASLR